MPELLKSIAGSVIRALLTSTGGWLIHRGYISESDWTELLAGIAFAVASIAWSIWNHYGQRLLVLAALDLPANSSLEAAKAAAEKNRVNVDTSLPLVLALVGLSSLGVACAKIKGAETAVYSAQTAAAWQGVQSVVVILDSNKVVEPGKFYALHNNVTNSMGVLFTRLEAGGYDRKEILVTLDQIAADVGQIEQEMAVIQDPGSKEKFSQILFSVRFGLNTLRAAVGATQRPDGRALLAARSNRPTTRALWWNDVMAVVANTFIKTTQLSYLDAPTAWADARATLTAIGEINAAKLGG